MTHDCTARVLEPSIDFLDWKDGTENSSFMLSDLTRLTKMLLVTGGRENHLAGGR